MSTLFDVLTNTQQFQSSGFTKNSEYHRKLLRDGDNRFRIIGDIRILYIHKFVAANGVQVTSVCSKTDDNKECGCDVCTTYKDAWKVMNAVNDAIKEQTQCSYSPEEIQMARILTGQQGFIHPAMKFEQSWGAKRWALMNVIDRDSDLNRREGHTSLLCKSDFELGISAGQRSIYEEIVKVLTRSTQEIKAFMEAGKHYLPFDINLIRSGKGKGTQYDRERSDSYDLTPEELGYEMYDLHSILKPTPDATIKKWLTTGTDKKRNDSNQQEQGSEAGQMPSRPSNIQAGHGFAKSAQPQTSQPLSQQPVTSGFSKPVVKSQSLPIGNPQSSVQQSTTPMPQQSGFRKPAPAPTTTTIATQPQAQEVEMDYCPTCNEHIPVTSAKCPKCGEIFDGYDTQTQPSTGKVPF